MLSARVCVAWSCVATATFWLATACGRTELQGCATCVEATAGEAAFAGDGGATSHAGSGGTTSPAGGVTSQAGGGATSQAGGGATNHAGGATSQAGGGATNHAGGGAMGDAGGGLKSQGGNAAGRSGDAGAAGAPATNAPIVLLLIDGSFSMFQSSVWVPTYEALMGASGPVERYARRVRFGFASYRGAGQLAEDDPACADMAEVPFALENGASIRETYGALETRRGYFETPTGHALMRSTAALLAEPPEARKYIILFSDGAPDTCLTTKPQCGQDRAVSAVQSAQSLGIETRAVGIGYGTEYDCNPLESRCGQDHFQDLANAGRGLPVQVPPEAYATLPCAAETGGTLLAEYAADGGLAAFSWAQSPEAVQRAVETILEEIVAP